MDLLKLYQQLQSALQQNQNQFAEHFHLFVHSPLCKQQKAFLTKVNIVSKALKEPGIEICTALKLLSSLVIHLETMRNWFDCYEEQAKQLVVIGKLI